MIRILHDDWSMRSGENRLDQSSQIFGGYAVTLLRECNRPILVVSH